MSLAQPLRYACIVLFVMVIAMHPASAQRQNVFLNTTGSSASCPTRPPPRNSLASGAGARRRPYRPAPEQAHSRPVLSRQRRHAAMDRKHRLGISFIHSRPRRRPETRAYRTRFRRTRRSRRRLPQRQANPNRQQCFPRISRGREAAAEVRREPVASRLPFADHRRTKDRRQRHLAAADEDARRVVSPQSGL